MLQACDNKSIPEYHTLQILEILPTVDCTKPKIALSLMSLNDNDFGDRIVMDRNEFESESFQRVYQYLRRHATGESLDKFSYNNDSIEGTLTECLEIFLRYSFAGYIL